AYEMPDGRLKLIDGHLRRDIDPNMEVEVEILDVNEEEARTLLLIIDPLAALAENQEALHERLKEVAPNPPAELLAAWQAEAAKAMARFARPGGKKPDGQRDLELPEQFMIVVTCRDELHQVELLGRFQGEGLECKALVG